MSDLVERARAAAKSNRDAQTDNVDGCEDLLEDLAAEIVLLKRNQITQAMSERMTEMAKRILDQDAEIDRLRGDLFEAHQALLREGMEVNRLRSESVGICGCAGKFVVKVERSDFEKDMV